MEKKNLMIYGHNGKLGNKICRFGEDYNYNIIKLERDLSNLKELKNCVIVDVTCVEGTSYLLDKLLENKINLRLIIGTTGDFNNIESKINKYSIENKVVKISNFSYGIPEIEKILKNFDLNIWKIKIKEIHHIHKKDAPSGTAKTLANICNYNYNNIESIREGEIFGIHEITLSTEDEEIIIIHKAKNRDIFAKGVFRFVEEIIN
tara:strand:- start:203 stop:817 length:615 start_codon:yes stop_codon:yes gene_type:complete